MPRREGPTGARRVKAAERTRQAIALKKAGLSLEAIGQRLGISKAAAGKALHRGLAELRAETLVDAEELRAIEAARLDQAQAAIWPRVLQGNDGAIDRFVRLSQRRAALLGLDAPTKVEQTIEEKTPPRAAMEAMLAGLAEKIAAREPSRPESAPATDAQE